MGDMLTFSRERRARPRVEGSHWVRATNPAAVDAAFELYQRTLTGVTTDFICTERHPDGSVSDHQAGPLARHIDLRMSMIAFLGRLRE